MQLGADIVRAIRQHAVAAYPLEACGFVFADRYQPVTNRHPSPTEHFEVRAAEWLLAINGQALALVHSHPVEGAFGRKEPGATTRWPFAPTRADMAGQIDTDLPWGIVVTDGEQASEPFWWGDFILDTPLAGQPFRHGVMDCYTAIRKWYWQERAVCLPEFPRDSSWWENGEDLYRAGFAKAGFRRLSDGEVPQRGDVGLTMVATRRALNHGFVYLGQGQVYHHLPGRLSRAEPGGRRLHEVAIWLRHEGQG
jgi:proteasome lid subunit RPN8/RPN11